MAIVEMKKLSVCALKTNRKGILETLQKLGVMEVTTAFAGDTGLEKMDTAEARSSFLKLADTLEHACRAIDACVPVKKGLLASLEGPDVVDRTQYDEYLKKKDSIAGEAAAILRAEKEIGEARGTILKDRARIEMLTPWLPLDVPMTFAGTDKTVAFIGTVNMAVDDASLYAAASANLEGESRVSADVIFSGVDQSGICVLCLKRDADTVSENLRRLGFARPAQIESKVPADGIRQAEEAIRTEEARIEKLTASIAEKASLKESFLILIDYYRTRAEKYRLLGTIPQSDKAFFLEGWVPASRAEDVSRLLTERYDAVVETETPGEDEVPPTLLHNNGFSRAVEPVVESYSLPTEGHVDPTVIMSFFYVIFFGMMLSDAGYGILMFAACAILLKKFPRMPAGTKGMLKLFFWGGLSTAFWGFMYGSFFGDVIDVAAKTFFGYTGGPILKPLWFAPLDNPMQLLMWCLLFGLIHLLTGLAIKGYEYIRRHDFVGFVSDVVSWFCLIIGLVLILLPTNLFASIAGMTIVFPSWLSLIAKGLTVIGLVVILLMSGRDKKNWGLRIALGAYDIYGVTSWLSDVLSYSRLLALGMATGVIASVVNMMASMFGGGVLGAILFTLIFLLGHTLNIGINALGAYVHTNRLQYVEFFGKFYDGGGKAFEPFRTANKYVEIKEDTTL